MSIKRTVLTFVIGGMVAYIPLSYSQASGHSFRQALVAAAMARTTEQVVYDGSYMAIDYPNGDVPPNIGVCTDVIIRSYRALGIDLQKHIHEDISTYFDAYPSKRIWNLNRPDSNIDHRRVPNLQVFFERHGQSLSISFSAADYSPGDIVTWMLPGNLPHIGIVSNSVDATTKVPLVIHNIGAGPEIDDSLFRFKITGHYRFYGVSNN